MILITGATGRIGGATLKYLSGEGMALRALVRSPDKAASVAAPQVETVIGDFAVPHSLDAALEGVDAAPFPTRWAGSRGRNAARSQLRSV